jgi:hypothetical protein
LPSFNFYKKGIGFAVFIGTLELSWFNGLSIKKDQLEEGPN